MKLLFDQNISFRILNSLPNQFEGSSHIKKENLTNSKDFEIWEFAKKNDFIIVTQDSDFNDFNLLYGFPPKIIWIRTCNSKTLAIVTLLIDHYNELDLFLKDEKFGCFEILNVFNNK